MINSWAHRVLCVTKRGPKPSQLKPPGASRCMTRGTSSQASWLKQESSRGSTVESEASRAGVNPNKTGVRQEQGWGKGDTGVIAAPGTCAEQPVSGGCCS